LRILSLAFSAKSAYAISYVFGLLLIGFKEPQMRNITQNLRWLSWSIDSLFMKQIFVFLLIFSVHGSLAAEPELIFYDSLEMHSNTESILTGGAYKEAQPLTKSFQVEKRKEPIPVDGYYHIRFIIDDKSQKYSRDFEKMFLNHEAFASIRNRFRIEYIVGDIDKMKCGNNTPESPRIISCDKNYITSLGTSPVHMTGVFTSRGSGGAGGSLPIMSIDYPLLGMLHEMLHTWGLQDEYTYSKSEADYYCKYSSILKAPNTTAFLTLENYTSNANARTHHWNDIPWIRDIQTPITTSSGTVSTTINDSPLMMGTPITSEDMEPGLYSGSNCSRKLPSFRAYKIDTVMKTFSSSLIPPIHQKAVLKAIRKVGGW
jgi:hypothetical protein